MLLIWLVRRRNVFGWLAGALLIAAFDAINMGGAFVRESIFSCATPEKRKAASINREGICRQTRYSLSALAENSASRSESEKARVISLYALGMAS